MTRAERLHAVLTQLTPTAAQHYTATGAWPVRPGATVDEPAAAAAPYVIETLPDGRRRVRVIGEDGDVVSGVGATLDDAIAALEAKVG